MAGKYFTEIFAFCRENFDQSQRAIHAHSTDRMAFPLDIVDPNRLRINGKMNGITTENNNVKPINGVTKVTCLISSVTFEEFLGCLAGKRFQFCCQVKSVLPLEYRFDFLHSNHVPFNLSNFAAKFWPKAILSITNSPLLVKGARRRHPCVESDE